MNSTVKLLAVNAMIAGVYAVLTLALHPISYLGIQMRVSEIMVFLAFYNKKLIPGLVLGCFIANLFSPLGIMDIVFGTLATLIATIAIYYLSNHYLAALAGALINGLIVGIELHLALNLPLLLNVFYVFVGELLVLLIAVFVFKRLENNNSIIDFIKNI